jgi:hypothetical protein
VCADGMYESSKAYGVEREGGRERGGRERERE